MLYQLKKNQVQSLLYLFILLVYSIPVAAETLKTGLGGVANNLMSPVNVLSNFIGSACLLLGIVFIFASIVKYIEHRRSPLMVPISTVLFLLIAGLILLCLPFLSMWTESGIPFWILK